MLLALFLKCLKTYDCEKAFLEELLREQVENGVCDCPQRPGQVMCGHLQNLWSVLARALSLALALGLLVATGRSTLARLFVASPAVVVGEEAAGQAVPWVELREGSVAASAAPLQTQRRSFRGRTACTAAID